MNPTSALFTHNVVPLYAEPNSASEQISQGLLGDEVQVLERFDAFVRVGTADDYSGWVRMIYLRPKQHPDPVQAPVATYPNAQSCLVGWAFADLWETPDRDRMRTKLVWGSRVTVLQRVWHRSGSYAQVLLPGGGYDTPADRPVTLGYVLSETLDRPAAAEDFEGGTACELAHRFIGTPYLWGGGTPFGFDCSGFVQRIYSVLGITLPRDAYLQAQSPLGKFREPDAVLQAGDLVFFVGPSDPRGRGITHVGIALGNTHFIHAYGKTGVTLDRFDDPEVRAAYTYRGSWRMSARRAKAAGKV